jgi:Tol biopolymer transport system component/DNA-binding winged helix-turn-helix (wHTH) protein
MATPFQSPVRMIFGPFELNAATGELLKSGIRVRLPTQPFQILLVLLAHPGEMVTREQLREQVWSEGTFVDFEHGLNAAINKLRNILGDSAEKQRYVETMAGRGYRFVGAVERRLSGPTSPAVLAEPGLTPAFVDTHPEPRALEPLVIPHRVFPAVKLLAALAAITTAFGIWGVVTLLTTKPAFVARRVVEFRVPPPPETIFAPPIARQPFAISPDGTRLAFTATGSNGTNIWIRDLASVDLWRVPGTEGAWAVFWSPDSRSIFYSVQRNLRQTILETGSTRAMATLPFHAVSGAWRTKGDLLLDLGPPDVYELLVENGKLWKLPFTDIGWPQFLPRDHFLNIVFDPGVKRYRATVTDYRSHRSVPLMETDSRVQYAPPLRPGEPGSLLYMRGASLLGQPFDADRLRLAGEPFPIAQNVPYFGPSASACFSVSDTGVLVFQTGLPVSELNWYDRAGHIVGTIGRPLPYVGTLRISPDGQQVAAAIWSPENGGYDIWIFEANGKESRRLTFATAVNSRPVWSPNGKRLVFGSSRAGSPTLTTFEMGDVGKQEQLQAAFPLVRPTDQIQLPTDWSGDGRFIVFDTGLGEEEQEVWLADTAGRKVMPLLHNEFAQWGAALSPDGKRVAFVSTESGRPEVYVQSFDSVPSPRLVGQRRQISRNGAWLVRWRPDGRELFFVGIDNWFQAVAVEATQRLGEPKPLFRIAGTPQYGTPSDFQFDVTKDGQRFIMSTTGSVAPPPFTVIENWQDKFHR